MMGRLVSVGALLTILLGGCVSADVMSVDSTPRPAVPPETVEVFLEEPSESFHRIALVEVSDQGWGKSLEDLRNRLVEEAGKAGGDGIIIGRPGESSKGAMIMPIGDLWYAANTKESTLVGIVFVWDR